MKKHEALPGSYLRQEDVDRPALVTIASVELEMLENDRGKDQRPVIYFEELSRGLVCNATNWDACEVGFGADDTDDWVGRQCVLFVDPSVTFGSKRVGGLRIRMPKSKAPTAQEIAAEENARNNEEEDPF